MTTIVQHIGQTKITVHSPSGFISMTAQEKFEWFRKEIEAENPVVVRIRDIVTEISLRGK